MTINMILSYKSVVSWDSDINRFQTKHDFLLRKINTSRISAWSFSPAMYEWAWSVFLNSFVFQAYNLQIHVAFYLLISDRCFLYHSVGN